MITAHRREFACGIFRQQADRSVAEFRGAGGDRDGERAADHRDARGAGAADRDRRGACRVINSSPGDLTPVFDAMLDKAMRLCGASGGALRSYDGDVFHSVAMRGVPSSFRRGYANDARVTSYCARAYRAG